VRPYLKGHKYDFRDAEAIAEAVQRPTMRFVALKTPEQLDLQALHRVRKSPGDPTDGGHQSNRGFLLAGRRNHEGDRRSRRSRCPLSSPHERTPSRPIISSAMVAAIGTGEVFD
jgi:hypothetical protein